MGHALRDDGGIFHSPCCRRHVFSVGDRWGGLNKKKRVSQKEKDLNLLLHLCRRGIAGFKAVPVSSLWLKLKSTYKGDSLESTVQTVVKASLK